MGNLLEYFKEFVARFEIPLFGLYSSFLAFPFTDCNSNWTTIKEASFHFITYLGMSEKALYVLFGYFSLRHLDNNNGRVLSMCHPQHNHRPLQLKQPNYRLVLLPQQTDFHYISDKSETFRTVVGKVSCPHSLSHVNPLTITHFPIVFYCRCRALHIRAFGVYRCYRSESGKPIWMMVINYCNLRDSELWREIYIIVHFKFYIYSW